MHDPRANAGRRGVPGVTCQAGTQLSTGARAALFLHPPIS